MLLFEKARLGTLTLRNRIVMPPMATLFGEKDGTVSSKILAYYSRRSVGGVGLVIVENTAIHPGGVNYPGTLEIHSDRYEDGLSALASSIKKGGAKAAIQLFHPGRQIHPKYAGNNPIAPSPVPCPVMGGNPKALELDEIHDLIDCFVNGAVRAKNVGFEAVEIHGAHGYLVAQFLSPFSNRRDDPYGGDAQRRARFVVEIIEGIRKRLGDSFPVILRISADEKVEGGLTLEAAKDLIPHIEKAGVTSLHVSAGCYPSMEWIVQPYLQPQACLKGLAAELRGVTKLPILAVGRINDPTLADSILKEEAADLVCMGRALIADPDLPNKAREGRFNEIRPCIGCNVCIESVGIRQTRCAVNPEMGRDEQVPPPVDTPCRILVVGGGPAGMAAALKGDALGHRVKLTEAGETLGGQLILARVPDSKKDIRKLLDYYHYQVEQSGIEVELGVAFRSESAKAFQPDHIILATGASPFALDAIKGGGKVRVIQAFEVLREGMVFKGDVVIVGGGPVGLDVAEFLVRPGTNVTILEMTKHIGQGLEWNVRKMKLKTLKKKGVTIQANSRVNRVEEGSLTYVDSEGIERSIQADTVVAAVGSGPYNPLERAVRDMGVKVTCIGDCKKPRGLAEAAAEGFQAVINIARS